MPEFKQRLTMRLNGRSKYSTLLYEIFADDQPTGIHRGKQTDGSPKYLIVGDVFRAADGAEFDNLAARGAGLVAWMTAHMAGRPEPIEEGSNEGEA